jgi:hypothetical protein
MIMCQAQDVEVATRKVKDFDSENVLRGGRLVNVDGAWWVQLGSRVPVREACLAQ